MLKPSAKAPALEVATVGGGQWTLADQRPETFTLIEFYRGYHCPRCKVHLLDLDHKVARFKERGCEVVVVSMDNRERAEKSKDEWGIKNLTLGYGLTEKAAREWGLYISKPIQSTEIYIFNEPGMFLVRPDGTLYSATVSSTPFHRPHFADVLEAIDMIRARNYPPRGDA
jgi:peroxiredoxin